MRKTLSTILLGLVVTYSVTLNAAELTPTSPEPAWSTYLPYVPEKHEYQAELGAMWEEKNLYWAGFVFGDHLGRCVYSSSSKCQQYLDYHLGWGSREGATLTMGMLSLRWQYVNFPAAFSPSFRLMAGAQNIQDDHRDQVHMVYGAGLGWTASLHPNFDMKVEGRVGGGQHVWSQVFISFNIKIDDWVSDFAGKVKKLGQDTWDVSGKIINSTVNAPAGVIDWLKQTEDKRE